MVARNRDWMSCVKLNSLRRGPTKYRVGQRRAPDRSYPTRSNLRRLRSTTTITSEFVFTVFCMAWISECKCRVHSSRTGGRRRRRRRRRQRWISITTIPADPNHHHNEYFYTWSCRLSRGEKKHEKSGASPSFVYAVLESFICSLRCTRWASLTTRLYGSQKRMFLAKIHSVKHKQCAKLPDGLNSPAQCVAFANQRMFEKRSDLAPLRCMCLNVLITELSLPLNDGRRVGILDGYLDGGRGPDSSV